MARRTDPILSKLGVVCLVLLVGLVGLGAWARFAPQPEPRFCTLGLAIVVVHGQEYVLQDQGAPGDDGCELGEDDAARYGSGYLTRDCELHRPGDGKVIDRVQPNRDDGSCGQRGPGDDRWVDWQPS